MQEINRHDLSVERAIAQLNSIKCFKNSYDLENAYKFYSTLGEDYLAKKKYIESMVFYQCALNCAEKINHEKYILKGRQNISFVLKYIHHDYEHFFKVKSDDLIMIVSDSINRFKSRLVCSRKRIKKEIDKISKDNSNQVRQKQQATTDAFKGILSGIFDFCEKCLIDPPCSFECIGMGSLGREEASMYSDIEYAILIASNNREHKEWFRVFARLFNLVLICLGETLPRSLAINPEIDLLPTPFKQGISLDGCMENACKTPLGKRNEKGEVIFELICNPEELVELYMSDDFFDKNRQLVTTLLSVTSLYECNRSSVSSSKEKTHALLKQFHRHLNTLHKNISTIGTVAQKRALICLSIDLMRFEPNIGKDTEKGKQYSIKYDLLRFVERTVSDLGLYFGVSETNIIDIIRALSNKKILSNKSASELSQFYAEIWKLRISKHLESGCLDDNEIFKDNSEAIVGYYLMLLGFHKRLVEFYLNSSNVGVLYVNESYSLENNNMNLCRVHDRLGNYPLALFHCLRYFLKNMIGLLVYNQNMNLQFF